MRLLGARGEEAAARHLKREGYEILERNWRSPSGEVDIIALDGEMAVFVEVKARSGSRFGSAAESVDRRKQQKITKTALQYLSRASGSEGPPPVRFDVITVSGGLRPKVVEHIKGAFSL
jgi:putative endonuclease